MSLYKYIRPERIDVLQNRMIRFTQPGALNDPFELRPRFETLISEAEAMANIDGMPIDLDPVLHQAYELLTREQRSMMPYESLAELVRAVFETEEGRASVSAAILNIFESMKDIAPPLREQLYETLNSNVGILSVSEVPDNLLMWAHYTDSHRGLVLEFDERHPFFNRRRTQNDEFYFLRKVIYSDNPPASTLLTLDGDAVFVTKASQWAYEREWRMLVPLKMRRDPYVSKATLFTYLRFPLAHWLPSFLGRRSSPDLGKTLRI